MNLVDRVAREAIERSQAVPLASSQSFAIDPQGVVNGVFSGDIPQSVDIFAVNPHGATAAMPSAGEDSWVVDPYRPEIVAPTPQVPGSDFSVFGDTGIQYGRNPNGGYFFGADPISAEDFAVLSGRGEPTFGAASVAARKDDERQVSQPKPTSVAPVAVPTASGSASTALLPTDPNFTVPTAAVPEFGMYGRSAAEYRAPQLMPANERFSTPYYAAYTNDGDLAGAVMVAPGQRIRLVDNKTGQVVFEGQGPEAAQQVVGIANAVSEDRGRKAAWSIQAEQAGGGWQTQAYERYDPKRSGFFGTLADIALPIIGTMLLGPIGAAVGSGLSSVAQGRGLTDSLLRAGLSYGGAQLGPYVSNAVSGALAPAVSGLGQGALQVGAQGVGNAATQLATQVGTGALGQGAGTLLSEVVVNGVRTLIPTAVAQSLGATAGSLSAGALTSSGGGSAPAAPPTVDVQELVVQGLRKGMSIPDLVALGIPIATVNAIASGLNLGTEVTPVDVSPPAKPRDPVTPTLGGGLGGVTTVAPVDVSPPAQPPSSDTATVAGAGAGSLIGAITSGNPGAVADWVRAHPLQAAGLGLTLGGLLAGAGGGGSGHYGIPGVVGGTGAPGTRGSLSPVFSASLPSPAAGFGVRSPRNVQVDQRYAIARPEASFFSNVPQRNVAFSVASPHEALLSGVPDLDGDGQVTDVDVALWRKSFGGEGFAVGGYAEGGGDGRSDDIEARLSDGEYVIDAETVALLGNGSSKAGADALDRFRVNVRKHKGRDLAKGRFSAMAKRAESYLDA